MDTKYEKMNIIHYMFFLYVCMMNSLYFENCIYLIDTNFYILYIYIIYLYRITERMHIFRISL